MSANPGIPSSGTPEVNEPTTPVPPLPRKPDQTTAEPYSPTGCPMHISPDVNAQQGEYLTTAQGGRLRDTDHSLRAGERGPLLMQDHHFREKITHFDHERIPERVVHARGAAAHGVFKSNGAAASICRAGVFAEGKETPVFTRFSTVLGNRGSADTVRDTRGFAVKFYTEEGTWDLVGNNIPVFFIQDGIKFPDIIHAAKPHPDRDIPQAQSAHDTFWDFVTLHTEATHHTLWNMSDRGIPRSYRMMEGFGVNTFRMINDKGETSLVKFHWKPKLGVHSQVWEEAQITGGVDPDFHRRDLADAIESGAFPEWDLGLQVFPDNKEQMFEGIDLLDPTKIVPEELAPVQIVGTMTLNKNVSNFHEETEQVAFHPGHLPPGIDVTADPLLQGRLFSYLDTQLSRLGGPNFSQLPINRPHAPVNDMFREGMHQHGQHIGVAPYQPNSLDGGNPFPTEPSNGALIDVPVAVEGEITRSAPASFDDHFSQARLFYLSLSPIEQKHVADAYTFELGKCYEKAIKERAVEVLSNVDHDLASTVAKGLGVPAPEKKDLPNPTPSPALSQVGKTWPIDGRQVGILVTDDLSEDQIADVATLSTAIEDAGMVPLVTSTSGGTIGEPEEATGVTVSRTYVTVRSIEFDAAVVVDTPEQPEVSILLSEMIRHGKAVALVGDATAQVPDRMGDAPGVVTVNTAADALDVLTPMLRGHRTWAANPA